MVWSSTHRDSRLVDPKWSCNDPLLSSRSPQGSVGTRLPLGGASGRVPSWVRLPCRGAIEPHGVCCRVASLRWGKSRPGCRSSLRSGGGRSSRLLLPRYQGRWWSPSWGSPTCCLETWRCSEWRSAIRQPVQGWCGTGSRRTVQAPDRIRSGAVVTARGPLHREGVHRRALPADQWFRSLVPFLCLPGSRRFEARTGCRQQGPTRAPTLTETPTTPGWSAFRRFRRRPPADRS